MATAQINGITMAYDDRGRGPDVLLLVHGHPFDRSMWRPQLPALAQGWRIVVPDLRGYGETTVVPGKTTLSQFAADLVGLLDHLDVDGFAVGGLSMGGQIAMEICRGFPDRVRGLILAATFPQAETGEGRVNRVRMADRLLAEGMEPYAAETLPRMISAQTIATQPAVAAHVRDMMRSAPPQGAAAALRGRAERPDYAGTLEAFDRPALVVVGDHDAFTTRADADRMQALLPDAELLWLEGVGHMPNLEAADAFNAAASRLLSRIGRP
ncbi:MAG: alpha/beta fold hydrolase [Alphaproteobacteria bacterium]|jgi:pimeloyl-ACP methyl ester carboxylesterase|nr:alpha/beta fold hydrolase [Alphaproteobacteria bacterium]